MPVEGRGVEQAVAVTPPRNFSGPVWRVHWREIAATDWNLSLRTSGRYHRGHDLFPQDQTFSALYTSLAPEIAIWEMVRRSAARNLRYLQNTILTELQVSLDRMLDVSDAAAFGLTRADLTGPDHLPCQELAALALSYGFAGLLVPSAALPGLNLVLLPRNLPEPFPLRVIRSTELPLDTLPQEPPKAATDIGR